MLLPFLQYIEENLLVADGAMGTMIYKHGIPLSQSFDKLNLTRPDLIRKIHREYIEAGAKAIETNSFTSNHHRLSRFGLEKNVTDINHAAVELAKEEADGKAYVLASVGPLRDHTGEELEIRIAQDFYAEQISALVEKEPDALILETFTFVVDLEIALEQALQLTKLPIIAQVVADEDGYTSDGLHITAAYKRLRQNGAAVVGINCAKGPNGILRALHEVPLEENMLISASPNAGLPAFVDGRYIYLSTPEYFAESALKLHEEGVRIIGGCCGTTPDHIRAIAEALKDKKPVTEKQIEIRKPPELPQVQEIEEPNFLKKVKKRLAIIVELDPPRELAYDKIITGARELKRVGIDALTMADNSLGVTRMSNVALADIVQRKVDIPIIIHLACRDRNLVGMQSELMGLNALGMHSVLALTGDPAKFGDQPGATSVFDLNSFSLTEMIKRLNKGIAFSGKTLKQGTSFTVGVAFNPNVSRIETQVRRLRRKLEKGADFVMTQPIFDPQQARKIHEALEEFNIPVFIGIMPLVSSRNADFLHNEVPGIDVPETTRKRLVGLQGEKARKEGVKIAAEILEQVLEYFNGIYLITPFMRYEMCVELVEICHRLGKK